jgi:hypothetical protein
MGQNQGKKELLRRSSPKSMVAFTEFRRLVVRIVRLFGDTQNASNYFAVPRLWRVACRRVQSQFPITNHFI